jgi:glycyl-tRNA synthetase beta chain
MPECADFLVEIGTEELPPKNLNRLSAAFHAGIIKGLDHYQLDFDHEQAHFFATPRRLAVLIPGLALKQPDVTQERQGPAIQAAFDAQGVATKAAEGFARSCGVPLEQLSRVQTDKGERLAFSQSVQGQPAANLLLDIVGQSLRQLPIRKPMRWGDSEQRFVRPVHWVLMMLGDQVIQGELFDLPIGNTTRGHRFHAPEAKALPHPKNYQQQLRKLYVVVDSQERQLAIREQARLCAAKVGGDAVLPDELVEEVANLLEWPVSVTGHFDESFLQVPQEALITSMENHQKFFPVVNSDGKLMPHFIAFANIASNDLKQVRRGFGRVIRPRLADAQFFWDSDRKSRLASHQSTLNRMVYQERLGSLWDKCLRVRELAVTIAEEVGGDTIEVAQAAELSKCDLLTDMVGEFPELQGIMGRYYALQQGETEAIAQAIEEHYLPRFAGDDLPSGRVGKVLGIADRIDTLCSIFCVGLKPSGNKDPYALRRAALGLVRILVECKIDLDLEDCLDVALAGLKSRVADAPNCKPTIVSFVMERMRAYYADQGISTQVFEAVWARRPTRLLDFDQRLQACHLFASMDPAIALAAANKRIANILRKAAEGGTQKDRKVDPNLLAEPQESALHQEVCLADSEIKPMLARRDYQAALVRLAELQAPVDAFFDAVMVMAEDIQLKNNRLALLATVKGIFDNIADISRLVIEKK